MKSFIAVAALLCAVIFALGTATPLPAVEEADALQYEPASLYEAAVLAQSNELMRQKRATCDLLSGFGVGDTACALHCIGHGNRGGYCERGTCHCRN